jgi:phosphate transport system protein
MRAFFAQQLRDLEDRIVNALESGANTLATIAAAVQDSSRPRTALIQHDARRLRCEANQCHADLVTVTARQTPVAADLRLVMSMVELAHHANLIANQFDLISEQLTELDPAIYDRANNMAKLSEMSALASAQLRHAINAFRTRDLAAARRLDDDDDAIDRLNRAVFEGTMSVAAPAQQRELGLHHVLIARSLERIGDNAVDIGEQAAFLLTSEPTEFTDASHPRSAA